MRFKKPLLVLASSSLLSFLQWTLGKKGGDEKNHEEHTNLEQFI